MTKGRWRDKFALQNLDLSDSSLSASGRQQFSVTLHHPDTQGFKVPRENLRISGLGLSFPSSPVRNCQKFDPQMRAGLECHKLACLDVDNA